MGSSHLGFQAGVRAALLALLAGTIGPSIGLTTSSPASAESTQQPPVAVRVAVPQAAIDGSTLAGDLVPTPAAMKKNSTLAWKAIAPASFVKVAGASELRLDPTTIPTSFVEPGGAVTINLHYENASKRLIGDRMITVRAAKLNGEPVWVDVQEHLPALKKAPGSRLPTLTASTLSLARRAGAREVSVTSLARSAPAVSIVPVAAPAALPMASPSGSRAMAEPIGGLGYRVCKPTGTVQDRWATIGTSYPLASSRSWLTYSASTSTTFGVGMSYDKGAHFRAAGTRSTSDEWGQDFVPRSFDRSFRVQVRYRLIRCAQHRAGKFVREVSRAWTPWYQTGGTADYRLSGGKPAWTHCVSIAAGPWYRGGSRYNDYSSSYGVKFAGVIGIDLSTQRAYTNGSRLYYDNPRPRSMCGNNDAPSRAGKIREARK